MQKFRNSSSNYYLLNFAIALALLGSICLMSYVQFKFDNLKNKIGAVEKQIHLAQDQIQMMDVEWAYLTRPARIRELSAKYLNSNGYASAYQIKSREKMAEYYAANSLKAQNSALAMNDAPATQQAQ